MSENILQFLPDLMKTLVRFLLQVASILPREDDHHLPAAPMNSCTHQTAGFFWEILSDGFFTAEGWNHFLRLVSEPTIQVALVRQWCV